MALYELMDEGPLSEVEKRTFTELRLRERDDIQQAVRIQVSAIIPGHRTMVFAEEFGDW